MVKSLCIIDDNEVDVYQVRRVIEKSGSIENLCSFCNGKEALQQEKDIWRAAETKDIKSYFIKPFDKDHIEFILKMDKEL